MELPQLIFHAGVNVFAALLEQKANSSVEEKVACRSRSICLFLQPPASHPHPAQPMIMYHEPFGISLFRSVEWNVLLLLFVLFGITKHVPFQRHRSMNGTIK